MSRDYQKLREVTERKSPKLHNAEKQIPEQDALAQLKSQQHFAIESHKFIHDNTFIRQILTFIKHPKKIKGLNLKIELRIERLLLLC